MIPQLTITRIPPFAHLTTPQDGHKSECCFCTQVRAGMVSKYSRNKSGDKNRCSDLKTHPQVELVREREKLGRVERPLKKESSCLIHGSP